MSSPDFESWMWAEACEMLERADRLHRQLLRPAVTHAKRVAWEPPIDIYETQQEIKIMIALPGIVPEHVAVNLEGCNIVVSGQRHLPVSSEEEIHRLEIPYGRFERVIELPAGRFELGASNFVNGCLCMSLHKL